MSKAVLLSIRPEWCNLILQGRKTVEVRKTKPEGLKTPFKCYIYCTLAGSDSLFVDVLNRDVVAWNRSGWPDKRGRVIGEFICDKIWEMAPLNHAPDDVEEMACMDRNAIVRYLRCRGWAWHISSLKVYDKPISLQKFTGLRKTKFGMEPVGITRPLQSWGYVEELE